ncbi:MAG: bacterial transcriptional activator domain-containing protein [Rhodobacteraceae bacterium]|nr:bacterial transcriptional activator domain-containing protein [Paracoccaceae bacterium]
MKQVLPNRVSDSSLAFFGRTQGRLLRDFVRLARRHLGLRHLVLVTPLTEGRPVRPRLMPEGSMEVVPTGAVGFEVVPISLRRVGRELEARLSGSPDSTILAVDMGWGLNTASATANFEGWMGVAEDLARKTGRRVVSLYNRSLLIDEHLIAALRGHPGVLAEEGVIRNPHWLPPRLHEKGTLREQVDFWLGGLAASLARATPSVARHAAEGADPMWLLSRRAREREPAAEGVRDRWKIRCFGRLRVYRADGRQIDWALPGGATMKTKTLFAYLLQQGGKGAAADDLADLLWPGAESAAAARNRLHHAVRCLRQVLDGGTRKPAQSHILRDGANYVLVPPERSWLDISTFEQLCRQSQTHIRAGDDDEALICLRAADRLYTGDLFEDIPSEYVDDQERDWCWTRRYWLRDMYLKVQRDAARIYRARQDHSAALSHCRKALALDPLAEFAHEEAMQVFAALGRREAIDRQYALYLDSLSRFDDRPRSESLVRLYRKLTA